MKLVENTLADSVTYLLDDVLRQLKIGRNDMLLLLSYAAAYMKSAGEMLKIIYLRMFHLPCLCHLLHNVCMTVKTQYSAINDIIASINACTVKNKTRQEMFYHLGTLPDPALTTWGSWISAAVWYSTYWLEIRRIVLGFEGDGLFVRKTIMAASSPGIGAQLTELYENSPCSTRFDQ